VYRSWGVCPKNVLLSLWKLRTQRAGQQGPLHHLGLLYYQDHVIPQLLALSVLIATWQSVGLPFSFPAKIKLLQVACALRKKDQAPPAFDQNLPKIIVAHCRAVSQKSVLALY